MANTFPRALSLSVFFGPTTGHRHIGRNGEKNKKVFVSDRIVYEEEEKNQIGSALFHSASFFIKKLIFLGKFVYLTGVIYNGFINEIFAVLS